MAACADKEIGILSVVKIRRRVMTSALHASAHYRLSLLQSCLQIMERTRETPAAESSDGEQHSQKRRRSFQSEQMSEYGMLTDQAYEPDGFLIDPLGRPYPPGHWETGHSDPLGLQQAAVEEALPAYEQFCGVLDQLDGCMATPKGAEHAELCVRALNELLASDKEDKAELVLDLLDTEGVRCHVQGQPPVMLTAVSVPTFVGLRRIWDKLLELGQDPDMKYKGLSPNDVAMRTTVSLRQSLAM